MHAESETSFSFVAVGPAEHTATVRVLDESTDAAVADVEIRLGYYRGQTDAFGISRLEVRKGTYELNVWRMGYELLSMNVEIREDRNFDLRILPVPEPQQEYWHG